jgi:hypothetical protein
MGIQLSQQPLHNRIDVRITNEQRMRLEQLARLTPGCSSPAGVVRLAIDKYLEQVQSDSSG